MTGQTVRIVFEGTEDALLKLVELYKTGELPDILGNKVQGINADTRPTETLPSGPQGEISLNTVRFLRLQELFGRALDLPDLERESLIADECKSDSELAISLRRLLAESANATVDIKKVIHMTSRIRRDVKPAGTLIGPWRIVKMVARGGLVRAIKGAQAGYSSTETFVADIEAPCDWVLGLDPGVALLDDERLHKLGQYLRETAQEELTIPGVAPGSIGVVIRSSVRAFSRLKAMRRAGQLSLIDGMPVEGIWPRSGGRFIGDVERCEVERCIFDRASRLPKSDRDNFIAEACKEDPSLAISIQGLMAASERSGSELSAIRECIMPTKPEIKDYEVDDVPLEGGQAFVYHGRRITLFPLEVAIKVMRPELRGDPSMTGRFEMEISLLGGFKHPNIPRIIGAGRLEDGSPYAVMEWIRGEPLREYIAGRGVDKRIRLFLQIARTVAYLHEWKVVHRDIKADNILVTTDGDAKILDFGIARALGPLGRSFTRIREVVGTPAWMSPQQSEGKDVGFPDDIWALGLLLRELLTDQRPCAVLGATQQVVRSKRLAHVVRRALSNLPEDRYPDAGKLADAVEQALKPWWLWRVRLERGYKALRSSSVTIPTAIVLVAVLGGQMLQLGHKRPPVELPRVSVMQPPKSDPGKAEPNTPSRVHLPPVKQVPAGHAVVTERASLVVDAWPVWDPQADSAPIQGRVEGVEFGQHRVALYTWTGDGWSLQEVRPIDHTTGHWIGVARFGSSYAALLVKDSYNPEPRVRTLPDVGGEIVGLKRSN